MAWVTTPALRAFVAHGACRRVCDALQVYLAQKHAWHDLYPQDLQTRAKIDQARTCWPVVLNPRVMRYNRGVLDLLALQQRESVVRGGTDTVLPAGAMG